MKAKKKRLEEIEEKLARLRELKKQIERKMKKEKALALHYAKEVAYAFLEATGEAEEKKQIDRIAIEYLKGTLCSRAKNKAQCLKNKLSLIAEYGDQFKKVNILAQRLLNYLNETEN